MANQITHYQHYVPQCYLRNFSDDKEHIFICYKPGFDFKRQSIESICGENYFYDMSKKEAEDFCKKYNLQIDFNGFTQKDICGNQPIEHFFAEQIESKLFSYIQKVINLFNNGNIEYGKTCFTYDDKFIWSLYAVFQFYRTPAFRENLQHSLTKTTNDMVEIMKCYQANYGIDCSKQIEEAKQTIEKASIRQMHLSQMKDIEHMNGMARIHFGMYKWFIGVAEKDSFFVTTDNPAILQARYANPMNDLYFPISDKLCFILHPMSSKNSDYFNDCSFIKLNKTIVKSINLAMINYSNRLIVSRYKFRLDSYIQIGISENIAAAKKLLHNGNGFCTVVKIDPIQVHPGSIFDFLDMNEFNKFGQGKKDAPLLYVNLITKVYTLGYYGSFYCKPIDGRPISQDEFIKRYKKIEPLISKIMMLNKNNHNLY